MLALKGKKRVMICTKCDTAVALSYRFTNSNGDLLSECRNPKCEDYGLPQDGNILREKVNRK